MRTNAGCLNRPVLSLHEIARALPAIWLKEPYLAFLAQTPAGPHTPRCYEILATRLASALNT